MISTDDFEIRTTTFRYRGDEFPLSKIKNVRVKSHTVKDHVLKLFLMGAIVSSIVWVICPEGFGKIMAPIAFVLGVVFTIFTIKKYDLQVEFEHIDETGVQWISVVGSSKSESKAIFERQASAIKKVIT
jgi:ABC-type transport system involved in cytochrome bd biosynthesis fused ATPase/permease subunit